jgi:hypothetical protein
MSEQPSAPVQLQETQDAARVLLWEGRELISGLWIANAHQEMILQNTRLACSLLEKERAAAAAQAQKIRKQVRVLLGAIGVHRMTNGQLYCWVVA